VDLRNALSLPLSECVKVSKMCPFFYCAPSGTFFCLVEPDFDYAIIDCPKGFRLVGEYKKK